MGACVPYSLYVSMPVSMKMVCDEKMRSPQPCVDCTTKHSSGVASGGPQSVQHVLSRQGRPQQVFKGTT